MQWDRAQHHANLSEQGIEEYYTDPPEPSVLHEDIGRLDTLTEAEEQELTEWLNQLEQEL